MRISDWSSDVCSSDLSLAIDDHARGVAAFELLLEHLFRDRARNRAVGDEAEQFGGVFGRNRRIRNVAAHAGQGAKQLAGHPVRSEARRVGKACVLTCTSGWSR